MKVAFGISFGSSTPLLRREDTRKFMDLVKMADDYGAEAIGTFDTAFIGGDAYVRATLIAQASARARVGLRPTNPLTREPQVMASFLASIDHLTDGRAFMDMASGDSAVLNIGYRAASRARIEDYVTCVRDLLAKGQATYQGRPQRVRWSSSAVRPRVPISICAEGPRMLHLGGRIGDGVVAGTGLLPEVIKDTIARVHAGAREAGRRPSDVEIWFTARSSLHEARDTALDNVKASVSSILNHSMRFGLEGSTCPKISARRSRPISTTTSSCSTKPGTPRGWRRSGSRRMRSSASRWPGTPVIGSSASSRSRRSGPAGSGSVSADTFPLPRRTSSASWPATSCRAAALRSRPEVGPEEARVRHG